MSNSTEAGPAFPSSDLRAWTRRLRRDPEPASQPAALQAVAAIDAEALDGAVGFAAEHVRRYIASGGRDDGWEGPRPILVLYARGRSSGRFRRLPLLFVEHEGRRYIVGSKGGAARHPDWFVNVVAEPKVFVRVFEELFEARARVLDDAERDALWPLITARYPMFAEYQAATPRRIPVVELVPMPAAAPAMRLRFFFDAFAGVCLWAGDDAARARYDYAIELSQLGLPADVQVLGESLMARYDAALDKDDPGAGQRWSSEARAAFQRDGDTFIAALRHALGEQVQVIDERIAG